MRPRRYAEDYLLITQIVRRLTGFNEASALCRGLPLAL